MNQRLDQWAALLLPLFLSVFACPYLSAQTPEVKTEQDYIELNADSLNIWKSESVEIFSALYKERPARSASRPSRFAAKTNLLHDLTSSPNLGIEWRMGKQLTLDLSVTYNPWKYQEMKKFNVIGVQPELRYWTLEPFNKHFWGLHATYANFNVVGVGPGSYMKDHLLKGNLYGGGISYGYHWVLSPRWAMEATLGVGYLHLEYDESECKGCEKYISKRHKNYFGPTKAGVSLIYMIK